MTLKTPPPDETDKALEPLILDGISEILDNGHNRNRDYKLNPLSPKEKAFIITTLYAELEDPQIPAGLIYIYGHILDYVKQSIIYN